MKKRKFIGDTFLDLYDIILFLLWVIFVVILLTIQVGKKMVIKKPKCDYYVKNDTHSESERVTHNLNVCNLTIMLFIFMLLY